MSIWDSIDGIVEDIQKQKVTAFELVEKSLKIIASNQDYSAIITTIEERALLRAKEIDEAVANGKTVGKLAGVPFIAKDNFLTFGSETTAASNMLKGFKAPYQSTAVNRLEAEGAICVAKANLDAFAHGSSTENSDFMVTKNPTDKTRVPGGSSGGSAAAVMLDMAPFALGTDTGGSIRLPASFCGAFGYKPTYGLVSRSGVVAMASSTDVIGPITRNVGDAQLVLSCMAGQDELDSTSISSNITSTVSSTELKGKRIGVIKELLGEGISEDVKLAIQQAVDELENNGAIVSEVSLPSLDLALACYYILVPAEISSNLSRYDGQRFEHSSKSSTDLEDSYLKARSEGFGKEAKRRIMIGTYVLSSGYYDAYYKRAQQVRTKIVNEFALAFTNVDFLVSPVAPTTAFKLGENTKDPLQMYLADVMTVGASLAGIPAASIPLKTTGLPIGLQIMAAQKQDNQLLAISQATEEVIS